MRKFVFVWIPNVENVAAVTQMSNISCLKMCVVIDLLFPRIRIPIEIGNRDSIKDRAIRYARDRSCK